MNNLLRYKKMSLIGKIAMLIFLIILIIAIFSFLFTVHPYNIPSGNSLEPPSKSHILGTDDLGIDIWSQICYGSRMSVIVGISVAFLSSIVGSLVGILSGYFGGFTDKILMRFTDLMIILPDLPTMIILGAFFGPSVKNIIIVLSVFSWTNFARVVRSKVLSIKEDDYIKIAKAYGGNFFYMTVKHFLPQIFPIIMVSFIRLIGKAVVAEASLSFLGLGDPTSKSWGLILHYAMNFKGIYFTPYWKWWILSPLVCIMLFVVSISFIVREFENLFKLKI